MDFILIADRKALEEYDSPVFALRGSEFADLIGWNATVVRNRSIALAGFGHEVSRYA